MCGAQPRVLEQTDEILRRVRNGRGDRRRFHSGRISNACIGLELGVDPGVDRRLGLGRALGVPFDSACRHHHGTCLPSRPDSGNRRLPFVDRMLAIAGRPPAG